MLTVGHGKNPLHGIRVKMSVQKHKELPNYTLVKKLDATNPGMAHGGSSSATHANGPDHRSEVFSGVREFIFA